MCTASDGPGLAVALWFLSFSPVQPTEAVRAPLPSAQTAGSGEDTLLPQAGPLVCSASGFTSEKHVGISAPSAVVSLWAHPWAQASPLQGVAAAQPHPRLAPAGRHCGSVLPPSAT